MIDPNASAYPGFITLDAGVARREPGITIRAEMASRIMAGLAPKVQERFDNVADAAKWAVAAADALIAELNKGVAPVPPAQPAWTICDGKGIPAEILALPDSAMVEFENRDGERFRHLVLFIRECPADWGHRGYGHERVRYRIINKGE